MSTHPVDIIANAIRTADGNHAMGAGQLAEAVAAAIATDPRFVEDAVLALKEHGPAWFRDACRDDVDREHVARIVLRSLAGE